MGISLSGKTHFILLLLSLLSLSSLASNTFSQEERAPAVGIIRALSGKVWVLRKGKKEVAKKAMELKKGDILEIEDHASATIVYFKGGKKEEYKAKALIEIDIDKSRICEGSTASVKESDKNEIIIDKTEKNLLLPTPDRDIAHGGGQFIRGILPPKHYFEDNHIERYAVVIGVTDYKDPRIPDLKYADADAQAFYDFITSPTGGSFQKENALLLINSQATLKNVKLAITNFLRKATDSDFVMIFIACHGEPEPDRPGNLYLLLHDSELDSLPATAYLMENVNADMKRYIAPKRLILFADACHSMGIAGGDIGTRGVSNAIDAALSTLKSTKEGWGIVSASRAGEVSMESDQWGGGHGVFTYYLLEGMKGKADEEGNKNGIVTLAEAFDFLEEKVKRATQNAQHPAISGNFDNNLPIGFPGRDVSSSENGQTTDAPRPGCLQINSSPEGASVYLSGKHIGTTPLNVNLASGAYPVTLKKRNCADATDTVFINPDETTDTYIEMAHATAREPVKGKPITSEGSRLEHAESSQSKEDTQKTKDNIDTLIKELESIAKEQAKGTESKMPEKAVEKRPLPTGVSHDIPISVKEFNMKMGVLSTRHDMERLRQKIIDALLDQKGLRVVERDLELQEAVLREQRLSGSILADDLFRIELGKIQGAAYICFGGVSPGSEPGQLVLRMEIVNTATTLIDTLEYAFKSDDDLRTVANNVAVKMRGKIIARQKTERTKIEKKS